MAKIKLGQLIERFSVRAESQDNYNKIPVLGVSNKEGICITSNVASEDLSQYLLIEEGCFAYNPYRINVGSIGLTPEGVRGLVSPAYVVFKARHGAVLSPLLLDFLKSKAGLAQINLHARGTVRKALRYEDLCEIEISLPSYNDQIKAEKKKNAIRKYLDPLSSEITHQQDLLKKLRQQILQDAISGKLTAEWRKKNPKVEPAAELLKRIQAEKVKLGIKQKPLPPIKKEEIPFELPEGWVWCRIDEICQVFAGNSFNSEDFRADSGVRCIKIANAGVQEVIETEDYLPLGFIDKYPEYLVIEGDIIIALTRPYIKDGLKVSRCPKKYDKSLLNQRVAAIRSRINAILDWVFLFLSTNMVLNKYQQQFEKANLQPNLKMSDVTHLCIPVPPELELIAILDYARNCSDAWSKLDGEVRQSIDYTNRLLQSILKEAFEA